MKPQANVSGSPDEPGILTPDHGMAANNPKTLRVMSVFRKFCFMKTGISDAHEQ